VIKNMNNINVEKIEERKHQVDPKRVQDEIDELYIKLELSKKYKRIQDEIEDLLNITFPVEMMNNTKSIQTSIDTGLDTELHNIYFCLSDESCSFRFELQEEEDEMELNIKDYSLAQLNNALDIMNSLVIDILNYFQAELDAKNK